MSGSKNANKKLKGGNCADGCDLLASVSPGCVGKTEKRRLVFDPATNGPQQSDLRPSGPPSGHGASGGARTYDRRVPADLRADSLANAPPTPPNLGTK
ncbi:hypothetical protein PoB_004987200 [Plakobranchus ocellatus]|uniref:Uncharacterized protein n=1 Tax=Plakobranchus ocellatus TaxID=259542 RepID=A0AAV4BVK7_9GAST|nr:hypothetical protein PoB_004987200 [Plakobranchus ocellatus]